MKPLPPSFFRRSADRVARELLGSRIIARFGVTRVSATILETEAYLGRGDPASHAYLGRRHRGNLNLYGPPGTWYVYRSYGIHWCANLVCGVPAAGAAVLLRGVLPLEGLALIRRRRRGVADRELANGPGKLCQALGITRALDGLLMPGSPVLVVSGGLEPEGSLRITPRIGITKAVDWPLRFLVS